MSSADRVALLYIAESTLGTVPANPQNLKTLRFVSESLNHAITNISSNEIRADRRPSDLAQVGAEPAGDINFELSAQSFDDFLEAALCGAWTANVLKDAATLKSFTVYKHLTDIPHAFRFNGVVVNGMNLTAAIGAMVTGTFSVLGLNTVSLSDIPADAVVGAAPSTEVMDGASGLGSILIDDVPVTQCISRMVLNISNGIRPKDCLGVLGHSGYNLGRLEVTGELEMYFDSATEYAKYLAATEFGLTYTFTKGANSYTIDIPQCKYESCNVVAEGTNTDVMMTATFRAAYNVVDTKVISITRV